jgi:alkanesulfonate monooxygenase SsuD/methylene tetrahydromethanopterin reductase-like flavin-dependent oxidoreductase (luciferase family)
MRRSVLWLLGDHPECDQSVAEVHSTAIEHARLADTLGFDSLWISEHHFRRISTAANPPESKRDKPRSRLEVR